MIRTAFLRGSIAVTGAVATLAATALPAAASPVVTGGVVPNPSPHLPGNLSSKLSSLLGVFMAIVIVACVAGVFMAAWKLAIAYRNHEMGEAAGKLGAVAAACILVGTASTLVTFLYS